MCNNIFLIAVKSLNCVSECLYSLDLFIYLFRRVFPEYNFFPLTSLDAKSILFERESEAVGSFYCDFLTKTIVCTLN